MEAKIHLTFYSTAFIWQMPFLCILTDLHTNICINNEQMSLKIWEGNGVHAKTMHIHKNEFLHGLLRLLDTEYNTNNTVSFFSVPILMQFDPPSDYLFQFNSKLFLVLQLPGAVVSLLVVNEFIF